MTKPSGSLDFQPLDDDEDDAIAEVELEPDALPAPQDATARKSPIARTKSARQALAPVKPRPSPAASPRHRGKKQSLGLWIGLAIGGMIIIGLIVLAAVSSQSPGNGPAEPQNVENPFEL